MPYPSNLVPDMYTLIATSDESKKACAMCKDSTECLVSHRFGNMKCFLGRLDFIVCSSHARVECTEGIGKCLDMFCERSPYMSCSVNSNSQYVSHII